MVMVFGDNFHRRTTAVATYSIAGLSIASLLLSVDIQPFAFVPIEFSLHPALSAYRLITAQFVHADIIHLVGNLIFLLAFGRSIESLVGSPTLALACIGIGAFSFLGSWLVDPTSKIPIIGASGSISFLMGAYTVIFPRSKLRIVPFLRTPFLRAWLFAGVWVVLQVWDMLATGESVAGVAYATHLAGFVIGIAAGAAWKEFAIDTDRLIAELSEEDRS